MPQFHVVRIIAGSEPEPCCGDDGEPIVFDHGRDASFYAETCQHLTGHKHQPRPIKPNGDWRAREQARMTDGTYRPLPWADAPWFKREETKDHFAHVSTKDASKITFTESEAKGEIDRQAPPMKPGRYLRQFYGDVLDANRITELTREYAAYTNTNPDELDELLFARTEDEIEHVYLRGPESCMSHDESDYDTPFHPVRVYAGFDLAIAYCKDEDGRIFARALCWPERKIYGRIYPGRDPSHYNFAEGDIEKHDRFTETLRREGFSRGKLDGARFSRQTDDWGAIVCPYIDGDQQVTVRRNCLVIGDDGSGTLYAADNTNGLLGDEIDERPQCDNCGERYDEGEGVTPEDRDFYTYCEDCAENVLHQCEATGAYYRYQQNIVTLSDGTVWSREHFEDHGATCEQCESHERASDIDGHGCCSDCEPEEEEEENEPDGRDESPDQLELPIPGATYRIVIDRHVTPERLVCIDARSRYWSDDWAEVQRVLAELRRLYPATSYEIETVAVATRAA